MESNHFLSTGIQIKLLKQVNGYIISTLKEKIINKIRTVASNLSVKRYQGN